jgi:hypothetical protein
MRTLPVRSLFACGLLLVHLAQAQVVIGPPVCHPIEPLDPAPARLTPWFYRDLDGSLVWGRQQFYEDPANTVFVLAKDLVTLDNQSGSYPEALLFNAAQFDPPEGIDDGQPRKLMADSLAKKGLQLYVNYSNRTIDPAQGSGKYFKPTFFLSIDGHYQNPQTTPTVPWSGFSFENVSATRGAFGCLFQPMAPHTAGNCDDLYVTAGIGYGLSDIDPSPEQQSLAQEAQRDRLMWRDFSSPDERWFDLSQDLACPGGAPRIPPAAAAGNSSGVVFADLTGDGRADLYIGKSGDNYLGAPNVLLINDGTGCFTDQTAARIPGEPAVATTEIAAADLDKQNGLDLVVANRCRRSAGCGAESEDYVLINNGQGFFTRVPLNPGVPTDSRSVAVGDLNHDTWPELVLGNAGSDGFSNELALQPAEDHPMQIFQNGAATGGTLNTFQDKMVQFLGAQNEKNLTRPLTHQVLLADLFSPGSNGPDGWLDLVIVNHRDILKDQSAFGLGSNVRFLVNRANWTPPGPFLTNFTVFGSNWAKAVALAKFTGSSWLDALPVGGNRFAGVRSELFKNLGPSSPLGNPWDWSDGFIATKSYDSFPGTERGYGFDFADVDDDGFLDAVQTSRGYNYLVLGLLAPFTSPLHLDLAPGFFGNGLTSNFRGRLQPQGMEDAAFADFDEDGDLDALLASQRGPSATWPIASHGNASPETIVLVNGGWGQFGYDTVGNPFASVDDLRIDMNGRTQHPGLADRVVAGDLDNDGDVDAFVHLFPFGSVPVQPVTQLHKSFFQRLLVNVSGTAGNVWFRDMAVSNMKNAQGAFDPLWNRGLGMDVLADFDNNGALDLYNTVGFAATSADVSNVKQTDDLLFLNGVVGHPFGVFTEVSAQKLPPRCQDVVQDTQNDKAYLSCGSFGLAQGDIDNDGDADAVVTHYSQSGRTNYPWLLVNRLNEPAGKLVDEYTVRTPIGSFSNVIHTPDQDFLGNPTVDMDYAMFPALLDWDGDGDLDLALQVVDDLPRMLENLGKDTNGDGLITAADSSPPGTFADVTDSLLGALKPTTDSQDFLPLDIDGDGDFDLVNDPFSDMVTVWRNDLQPNALRPVVSEIWPRVGAKRGTTIRLHGVNLQDVSKVRFRFAGGGVCNQTVTTPVPGFQGTRLDVTIPPSCTAKGLAQVLVERTFMLPGCSNRITVWSRQYFGYFVLS